MVSVFSVVFGQVLLAVAFGVLRVARPRRSNFRRRRHRAAVVLPEPGVGVGQAGPVALVEGGVPFWGMAFLGPGRVHRVRRARRGLRRRRHDSRLVQTLVINGASMPPSGVLWVAKFVILNKLMFAHHEERPGRPPSTAAPGIPT